MRSSDKEAGLRSKKVFAGAAIALWLVVLAFVSGPMRWEFQHTYAHWIGDLDGNTLPTLTGTVSLPILGIGEPGLGRLLVRCVFWGVVWLVPCAIIFVVCRAKTRQNLVEALLLSAIGYVAALALFSAVLMLGLWLPFALL